MSNVEHQIKADDRERHEELMVTIPLYLSFLFFSHFFVYLCIRQLIKRVLATTKI